MKLKLNIIGKKYPKVKTHHFKNLITRTKNYCFNNFDCFTNFHHAKFYHVITDRSLRIHDKIKENNLLDKNSLELEIDNLDNLIETSRNLNHKDNGVKIAIMRQICKLGKIGVQHIQSLILIDSKSQIDLSTLVDITLEAINREVLNQRFIIASDMYAIIFEESFRSINYNINFNWFSKFNKNDWWGALDAFVGHGCMNSNYKIYIELVIKKILEHANNDNDHNDDTAMHILDHIELFSTKINSKLDTRINKEETIITCIQIIKRLCGIETCPPKVVENAVLGHNNDFIKVLKKINFLPLFYIIMDNTDIDYHNQVSSGDYQSSIDILINEEEEYTLIDEDCTLR